MSSLNKKVVLKKGRITQQFDASTVSFLLKDGWERVVADAKSDDTNTGQKNGQKTGSNKPNTEGN